MKVSRNDYCPCGSGKKYKNCCIGEPLNSKPLEEKEAERLVKAMEDSLPIPAYPTPELCKNLSKHGTHLQSRMPIWITHVLNSGDLGGIVCGIAGATDEDAKAANVVSLTHLKVAEGHPLQQRIETYQRMRTRHLTLYGEGKNSQIVRIK